MLKTLFSFQFLDEIVFFAFFRIYSLYFLVVLFTLFLKIQFVPSVFSYFVHFFKTAITSIQQVFILLSAYFYLWAQISYCRQKLDVLFF